ncbi:hypothetical protein F511_20345 [Dorcoceras hygrometricum]|uniref:Uncharacterized protein n=1 Tax=Dorcoceras hygrometricum TaxID=472368 RepID=A0A2Z7A8R7_9LAMI|nr:hypothetical protein F511_20345 [Dorcoceras hygrometricum]
MNVMPPVTTSRPEDRAERSRPRKLVLRSGVFHEDIVMTSRILPKYVFPYLNDRITEDHGEDLVPKIAVSISPEIPDVGEYSPGYAHLHRLAPL